MKNKLDACFCSSKGNKELYLAVQWVQNHAVDAGQTQGRRRGLEKTIPKGAQNPSVHS